MAIQKGMQLYSDANAFVIKELMNHAKFDTTNRYVKVSQQETVKYINAIL